VKWEEKHERLKNEKDQKKNRPHHTTRKVSSKDQKGYFDEIT